MKPRHLTVEITRMEVFGIVTHAVTIPGKRPSLDETFCFDILSDALLRVARFLSEEPDKTRKLHVDPGSEVGTTATCLRRIRLAGQVGITSSELHKILPNVRMKSLAAALVNLANRGAIKRTPKTRPIIWVPTHTQGGKAS